MTRHQHPEPPPSGVGYVVRRASGEMFGPFATNGEAFDYVTDESDEVVRFNEHGNVIDYAPQFDDGAKPSVPSTTEEPPHEA